MPIIGTSAARFGSSGKRDILLELRPESEASGTINPVLIDCADYSFFIRSDKSAAG
jgi:hypothetical protein